MRIFKVICESVHNTKKRDENLIKFVKAENYNDALKQAHDDWKIKASKINEYKLDKTFVVEVDAKYDPTRIDR